MRALLNNTSRKVGAVTGGQRFADNAHAIARIQFEASGLENSRIAKMNINLLLGRLKNYMAAHGRSIGGRREFYDRAEKEAFAAYFIRAQLLRIRLSGLLGL